MPAKAMLVKSENPKHKEPAKMVVARFVIAQGGELSGKDFLRTVLREIGHVRYGKWIATDIRNADKTLFFRDEDRSVMALSAAYEAIGMPVPEELTELVREMKKNARKQYA